MNRLFRLSDDDLPFVLLFVALAAFACAIPAQSDTFYHLRSGRAMWETGWLLERETFSHTAHGLRLHNHWWLSQLAFYGLYELGGPPLLTAAAGACAFFALYLSWRLVRGTVEIRLLLSLALLLVVPQWSVRPQVFSMILLMILVRLVIADRLVWIPPLLLVWANAHALVVMGVAVACAVALEAMVWSRNRLPAAVLTAIAAAAVPMVSPLGFHYWPRVIETVRDSRGLGILEYRSAFTPGADALGFWILLAAVVAAAVRGARRLDALTPGERALLLTSGVFAIAAMMSLRNVAMFALVAVPVCSWLLRPARVRVPRPARSPAYAMVGIALVLAALLAAYRWRDGGATIGWRPIAPGAVAAIRACPGPLFNEFDEGGILTWFVPERPVFVDGRVEAYPREFLQRSARVSTTADYRALFDDYRIRCAALDSRSRMTAALRGDPDMRLTYADDRWSVFERAQRR